jgi:hypothetical protein
MTMYTWNMPRKVGKIILIYIYIYILVSTSNKNKKRSQEEIQLAETTPNEADVTSSNLPSPLLCGHVKKKKSKYRKIEKKKKKHYLDSKSNDFQKIIYINYIGSPLM